MIRYTDAERCMMLLFADLDGTRPLSRSTYQRLSRMLEALGGSDGRQQVSGQELSRLGATAQESELILSRLNQEAALAGHLELLRRLDITLLTRISPQYPMRLRQVLGNRAPMVLYCAGNLELFDTECVSLVGSRQLREPGRHFSQVLGRTAAEEQMTYVSGGAIGADTVGFRAAVEHDGRAIIFLADSLRARRKELLGPSVLLVSEYGFDQAFSAARAYSRNRLIHAMGEKVFVAQTAYGSGGTWNGVMENLKAGWSPVFLCAEEGKDPGTVGLLERGCTPVYTAELKDLRALGSRQTSLFELPQQTR